MPRIRSIKPQFWIDENLGKIPRDARLLYIGLWNLSDDQGVFEWRPGRIKIQLFAYDTDISNDDINKWLDMLVEIGDIEKFKYNGKDFGYIMSFLDHQEIKNPSKWQFAPTPVLPQSYPSPTPVLPLGSRGEGSRGEGSREKEKEKEKEKVVNTEKDLEKNLKIDEKARSIWQEVLKLIQTSTTKTNYNLRFANTFGISNNNGTFVIGIKNGDYEYFDKHQRSLVEENLFRILGSTAEVIFERT